MNDEYRDLLRELGWSQRKLARLLGLHENTPSKWKGEPPGYVMAYLRLVAKVKRLAEEL